MVLQFLWVDIIYQFCSLGAHYERDVSSILANSNYVSILRDEEIVLLTRQ